jgi:hypothetical protein
LAAVIAAPAAASVLGATFEAVAFLDAHAAPWIDIGEQIGRDRIDRDLVVDVLLDLRQGKGVGLTDERDRITFGAGTRGPPMRWT